MNLDNHIYDLIIIGAGPAGMSAGIYAGRAMLDTLILEKGRVGGQVTTTEDIVNYPGFKKVTGAELMQDMYDQVEGFGVVVKKADIQSVDFSGDIKLLHTASLTYQARAIIIATGAQARKIGFPGEIDFTGRGIAYCSTCDGEFYKGAPVFVVGGGFAAAEEAVFLTRFASEVTVLVREGDFSCAKATADAAKNHPQVKVLYHTEVKEVSGEDCVNRICYFNNKTGKETVFEAPRLGVFVLAGTVPQTQLFKDAVEITPNGYIPVNEQMHTNVPGVYAAGDILPKTLRQIVTAISDGAVAATDAHHFVSKAREAAGLPAVSEVMVERQKALLATPKEEATAPKGEVKSGQWFNEKMATQLQGVFGKLEKPVELALFLDDKQEKTTDMRSFMTELTSLSDKISLKEYSATSPTADKYGVSHTPAALIMTDGVDGNIRFSGIPSGHELNSLVLALYNAAGPGQAMEEALKERIKALGVKKIDICVSLTCHFCPDVVTACQHMAAINPKLQARMIDAALFSDLKDQYKLMSFPTTVINEGEKILYGAQTMEQIVEALESM